MTHKLKELSYEHLKAKEAYDKAVGAYKNAHKFTFYEKAERYHEVQEALVEVQFRLNMLQAHVEGLVGAKLREAIKEQLAEESEAEQDTEYTYHEPLFDPEYEG